MAAVVPPSPKRAYGAQKVAASSWGREPAHLIIDHMGSVDDGEGVGREQEFNLYFRKLLHLRAFASHGWAK